MRLECQRVFLSWLLWLECSPGASRKKEAEEGTLWLQQGGQDMDSPGLTVGGPISPPVHILSACGMSDDSMWSWLRDVRQTGRPLGRTWLDPVVLPQARGAIFRNESPCLSLRSSCIVLGRHIQRILGDT